MDILDSSGLRRYRSQLDLVEVASSGGDIMLDRSHYAAQKSTRSFCGSAVSGCGRKEQRGANNNGGHGKEPPKRAARDAVAHMAFRLAAASDTFSRATMPRLIR